ncbi:hypothetical protein SGRIM128S_09727 [Streptomyces griseomycini]
MYQRAQKDLKLTRSSSAATSSSSPTGRSTSAPGLSPSPQPDPSAGGGSGTSSENLCARPKSDRFFYQPLVNGRPQGATALICPQDLKKPNQGRDNDGNPYVAGFPNPNPQDANGLYTYNRTHIIADQYGGEWRSENLFTGYRQMNTSGMRRCESRVSQAVEGGQPGSLLRSAELSRQLGTETGCHSHDGRDEEGSALQHSRFFQPAEEGSLVLSRVDELERALPELREQRPGRAREIDWSEMARVLGPDLP